MPRHSGRHHAQILCRRRLFVAEIRIFTRLCESLLFLVAEMLLYAIEPLGISQANCIPDPGPLAVRVFKMPGSSASIQDRAADAMNRSSVVSARANALSAS